MDKIPPGNQSRIRCQFSSLPRRQVSVSAQARPRGGFSVRAAEANRSRRAGRYSRGDCIDSRAGEVCSLEAASSPEPPRLTAPGEPAATAGETALTPERVNPAALEAASAPEPLKLTARGELATAAGETAPIPEPARPAAPEVASTPEPPELPASGELVVAAGETATIPETVRPGLHSRAAEAHFPRRAGRCSRGDGGDSRTGEACSPGGGLHSRAADPNSSGRDLRRE